GLFGPMKEPPNTPDTSAGLTKDLTRREIAILAPIAVCCIFIGVYPKPLLESFEVAIRQHVLLTPAPRVYTMSDQDAIGDVVTALTEDSAVFEFGPSVAVESAEEGVDHVR
ncbi:MAG: hypothetical protein IIC02_13080, partial [Planctomycetes bacterium]|nr:hypothetical protein [Planctomycetota bacterium]